MAATSPPEGGDMTGVRDVFDRLLSSTRASTALSLVSLLAAAVIAATGETAGAVVASTAFLGLLIAAIYGFWLRDRFRTPYDVLSVEFELDIADKDGSIATWTKRSHVRYLQSKVVAIWDDYDASGRVSLQSCTPGVVVDTFQDGSMMVDVISLRQRRARGAEELFTIVRTIEEGFMQQHEGMVAQTGDSKPGELTLKVVFPKERPPQRVFTRDRRRGSDEPLPASSISSAGERRIIEHRIKRPRRSEQYQVSWDW